MKRSTVNYWVDVGIAIAFVLSAVSGLVFLLPFRGSASILGIGFLVWDQVHLWSSLGMIAGVLGHLVLHSNWIVCMTKKVLLPANSTPDCAVPAKRARGVTRRGFLSGAAAAALVGIAALTAGALGRDRAEDEGVELGLQTGLAPTDDEPLTETSGDAVQTELQIESQASVDAGSTPTADSQAEPTPESGNQLAEEVEAPVQQPQGVACPRGVVNDPYPGRCRSYTDRNGDGICDFSVPGSGENAIRG